MVFSGVLQLSAMTTQGCQHTHTQGLTHSGEADAHVACIKSHASTIKYNYLILQPINLFKNS